MKDRTGFVKKVCATLKDASVDLHDKGIIVGLSGGVDSVGLLLLLNELKSEYFLRITAVHINHLIRDEAYRDERFCEELCERLGIPIVVRRYEVKELARQGKMGEEETGRILRRRTYEEILEKENAHYIALGHHIEDRVETIIHNMARGTGLNGFNGMSVISGSYLRPMLYMTKDEIKEFVLSKNTGWVEDVTNDDTGYTRNHIRKNILPGLLEINPNAFEHICSLADMVNEANETITGQSNTYLRKEIVRNAVRSIGLGLKDITQTHINDVAGLYDKPVGKRVDLPYGIKARRTYDDVIISATDPGLFFKTEVIDLGHEITDEEFAHYTEYNDFIKYFDCDIISDVFSFRFRLPGDTISLRTGQSTKLKDFFINEKVPRELRDSTPLVAVGSDIVWITGMRISEKYKITKQTRRILRIEFSCND